MTPPTSSVASIAPPLQSRTTPSRDEPARVNVRQARAVRKAMSPRSETAWPLQRSRKSRCRSASRMRSRPLGAVTASIRPKLSCADARPDPRRLRAAHEQSRQGGEPREDRAPRRRGRGKRGRRRPLTREVERDRRRRDAARGGGDDRVGRVGGGDARLGLAARDHPRRRLDHRAAREPREALEHEPRLRSRRRARRALPEDPPLRRGRRRAPLPRVGGRGARRGAGRGAARGLADRPHGLLRPAVPRALPHPRARGRRARHGSGALHALHRQGPLARPPARARDREPELRRRGGDRRDDPGQAELRPLADRRPVGHRRRAGTRRGNGDLGRARPGAARGGSPQPAVAREPRPGRLPLAHPGLVWLEESEEGREWLVRLPDLVHECTRRWRLELEEPFEYAFASLAVPAGDAVLKIQFPDRESEHEAEALRVWEGEGAVRLLDHDPERHALLLERARPGTPLYEAGQDTALDVTLGLLPRLWKPVGAPFRPLAEEAAWWIDYMPGEWEEAGRPFERQLLDAALDALRTLAPTQGEQVLVHQDFHAQNVLRAEREPWLVIDARPLAGGREFGIASTARGSQLGQSSRSILCRLDRLTAELGLDRDRARGWALGQTIAWGIGHEGHAEVARWLVEAA